MSDYLHDNGFYYSTNEVVNFAKDAGMDFDDFIKDRKLKLTEFEANNQIDIEEEKEPIETEIFVSKGNKEVTAKDMSLSEIQAEYEARKGMSYEDWEKIIDKSTQFSKEATTLFDDLTGKFGSIFGGDGVISRAYDATGMSEEKKGGFDTVYAAIPCFYY